MYIISNKSLTVALFGVYQQNVIPAATEAAVANEYQGDGRLQVGIEAM